MSPFGDVVWIRYTNHLNVQSYVQFDLYTFFLFNDVSNVYFVTQIYIYIYCQLSEQIDKRANKRLTSLTCHSSVT